MTGKPAPDIINEVWLSGVPIRMADLKGKVVMVEFWTFGCYNCRNVEPYVKQWHQKYADKGLVIIGVHSPEFSYERSFEGETVYPRTRHPFPHPHRQRLLDVESLWQPLLACDVSHRQAGVIRHVRIGEGGYQETERLIQSLLAETFYPA